MSPSGIGASALRYWETRQAAVSNNLANVATPGFKGERVFARLLDDSTLVADGATDFSPGSVTETGRPLDVALAVDGFFVVDTPDGRRWVRSGSFSLDENGTLVDMQGRTVLGREGPLALPPGPVEITLQGVVKVNGEPVGTLLVERAKEAVELQRAGENLWLPPEGRDDVPLDAVQVRQGHLEESNVNPVTALVEMMEIQRAYAAVQRGLQVNDSAMEALTTQIGRVG
ncbi:MAG: flagellar hook-basal body protein [Gemmatimonadota bacterium]